jgi:general secretion pathway protein J
MTATRARSRGFTLVELMIALVLLACMSAVMFGSLSLASRSWDSGEAKSHEVSDMRSTQTYLRAQISAQYPQRLWKVVEIPLLFGGGTDEIRYAAALPPRVAEGGVYLFRVALVKNGDKSQLVQERMIADTMALQEPEFRDPERSVLADGIAELRIAYFGRDPGASETDAPTWRDRWEDKQQLPLLVRIDVKPEKGSAWPTLVIEPRRSLEAGCPAWDPAQKRCTRTL